MPKIKKLTMDCPSCDEFFIIAYMKNAPEMCPFCGTAIDGDDEHDDEPEETIEDTYNEE